MKNEFIIPADIEPEAQEYMAYVLEMLKESGIVEDVDCAALNMLARNYSTFIKASKIIEEEGMTVVSPRGLMNPHPAIKIANDAQTKAMKVMAEFGLTARARTKLPQLDGAKETDSPLEAFVKETKKEIR